MKNKFNWYTCKALKPSYRAKLFLRNKGIDIGIYVIIMTLFLILGTQ